MEMLAAIVLAGGIEAPPPEYDRPPERAVLIQHMSRDDVDRQCRWMHPALASVSDQIEGCASAIPTICHIVLPHPSEVEPGRYVELMRHELAH